MLSGGTNCYISQHPDCSQDKYISVRVKDTLMKIQGRLHIIVVEMTIILGLLSYSLLQITLIDATEV